jgi:putative NIF3 family GTP cyclohydrolase 1 type 2
MFVGNVPEKIKKVAYCTGSGMSLAEKAFYMKADVFISGDIKYHIAQSIKSYGLTIDVGHFILEEIMMQKWTEKIIQDLDKLNMEVKFFKGKDPIYIKEV